MHTCTHTHLHPLTSTYTLTPTLKHFYTLATHTYFYIHLHLHSPTHTLTHTFTHFHTFSHTWHTLDTHLTHTWHTLDTHLTHTWHTFTHIFTHTWGLLRWNPGSSNKFSNENSQVWIFFGADEDCGGSSPQDPRPHLQKMKPWHPAALKVHDPTSKKWSLDTQQPSRSMTPPPKNEALTPSSPQDPWPHLQKMKPWHPAALKIHDLTSKKWNLDTQQPSRSMTPPPKNETLTPSSPEDPWPHLQKMKPWHPETFKIHDPTSKKMKPWHPAALKVHDPTSKKWSLDTQQPSRSMTPPPKNEALTPRSPQDPWPHLQKMKPWHPAALKIHDPTSKKWNLDTQQLSRSMTPPPKNEALTPSSPQDPWPLLQKMKPWHPAALKIHDPTSRKKSLDTQQPSRSMTPPPKNEALTPRSPQDPWPHLQKMKPWHSAALKVHDPTSGSEFRRSAAGDVRTIRSTSDLSTWRSGNRRNWLGMKWTVTKPPVDG